MVYGKINRSQIEIVVKKTIHKARKIHGIHYRSSIRRTIKEFRRNYFWEFWRENMDFRKAAMFVKKCQKDKMGYFNKWRYGDYFIYNDDLNKALEIKALLETSKDGMFFVSSETVKWIDKMKKWISKGKR